MGASLERALAALTGLSVGVAVGSLVWQQSYLEIALGTALALALVRLVGALPTRDRDAIWKIVLAAFVLRAAAGALLHLASLEIGRDGFLSGDDREYFQLASDFVAYLRGEPRPGIGPPYWGGSAYLFGTWVYFQSVLIAMFGDRPVVPVLFNGAFGAVTLLTCWDLARRMFGRRSAYVVALLLAFHPSLTLWGATNLKDTFALFVIAVILWSLIRFLERARLEPLVMIAMGLVAMQGLRTYIFVGLSLVVPIATSASPGLTRGRRWLWTAAATALSVTLLAANQAGIGLAPALLTSSIQLREGMGMRARTGFQEAPPVRVEIGMTFVVPTPSPAVDATPAPPPNVVVVEPNARIVVIPSSASVPVDTNTYVRPGDVIVIGPPGTSPAPEAQRIPLPAKGQPVQMAPQRVSEDELTRQALSYLPKGLVYAVFAPWPWLSDRPIDVVTVPEMLLWYGAITTLPVSLWLTRGRWRYYLGPLLFVSGTLFVFALVEGNWGTLFRHRAMVIPFVFVLASPGLIAVVELTRRMRAVRGRREERTSA